MQGMALSIALASLCIMVLPGLLFGGVGYYLMRERRGWLGGLLGFALGLIVGVLSVTATFYEQTWDPLPALVLEVPPGFDQDIVVLLGDASADAEVRWTGADIPFFARTGHIEVPASGIMRVRALEGVLGGNVALSTGASAWGSLASPVPDGVRAERLFVLCFRPYPGCEPDIGRLDADALRALIAEREAATER